MKEDKIIMKNSKLFLALSLLTLSTMSLASCGTSKITMTGNYITQAKLEYMNFRPTYNYYVTTFTYQELETYSDNTYVLSVYSTSFSALILPEEGNAATGNERTNFVKKYFGTYTSIVDELDPDTLNVTLSTPTRFVFLDDAARFYDTANWTEEMGVNAGEKDSAGSLVAPAAVEEFLSANAFNEVVAYVSTINYSFDMLTLVVAE